MKRLLAAAALAAVAAMAVVDTAEAAKPTRCPATGTCVGGFIPGPGGFSRRGGQRGGGDIVVTQPGLDLNTLLLLGATGGGGGLGLMAAGAGGGMGILPVLLMQQLLAPQVIETRRGRRR